MAETPQSQAQLAESCGCEAPGPVTLMVKPFRGNGPLVPICNRCLGINLQKSEPVKSRRKRST